MKIKIDGKKKKKPSVRDRGQKVRCRVDDYHGTPPQHSLKRGFEAAGV